MASEPNTQPVPKVLAALSQVMADIAATGIAKGRRNVEQRFDFRGIDDALKAFAPSLIRNKLLLSPSYSDKVVESRPTAKGGTTYNVSLSGTFTFVSIEDGSTFSVGPFFGEANDGQDKAVSKATSVAERNMFFLTFVVPHEAAIGGDPDGYGEPEETDAERAAHDWIRRANKIETPEQYLAERAAMMEFYGASDDDKQSLGKIHAAVKRAFYEAHNDVMPKD